MSSDISSRKDPWCKTCGQFMLFPRTHTCPPKWYVYMEDYHEEDEPQECRGDTPEDAAKEFARLYDECDHPLLESGTPAIVQVWNDKYPERRTFEIYAEATVATGQPR